MRTIPALVILLATSATASADHASDFRTSPANLPQNQQPQTEARYRERNQLADVRLDAAARRTYVQLPQSAQHLDYLELRAGRTAFQLSDVEVRFADGTSLHTGSRGLVEPFEGRVIDLPAGCARVIAIIPHYQTSNRFRGARLEVFGVPEHRRLAYRR